MLNFYLFISNFINLDLLLLSLVTLVRGVVNLVYLFKEPPFHFIDSLYFFILHFIFSLLFLFTY
jgi:hypothetical protein